MSSLFVSVSFFGIRNKEKKSLIVLPRQFKDGNIRCCVRSILLFSIQYFLAMWTLKEALRTLWNIYYGAFLQNKLAANSW